MSAPVFGTAGAAEQSTGTAHNYAVPASVASGDIIVIPIFIDGSTTTITTMPAGFAHAENSPRTVNAGGGGNHSLNVVWKRASAADTGTYDFVVSASAFVEGNAIRYTGCIGSGSPWDSPTTAADGGATTAANTPDVSITTQGPDRMLVLVGTNWAGGAWTPASGWNERVDNTNSLTLNDLVQVAQGSTGNVHATNASTSETGAWLGALIGTTPSAAPSGPLPVPPRKLLEQLARSYQNRFQPEPPAVPAFVAGIITARRSIAATTRLPRGHMFPLPQAAVVVVQPTFVAPQIGARHPVVAPTSRLPRGRFLVVPPTAVTFVCPQIGVRHPVNPFPRGTGYRGKFLPVPTAPIVTPAKVARAAIHWPGAVRRGQIFPVPVPVVVVTTGPWVPRVTRLAIHWPGAVRRGRFISTPVSAAITPPRTVRPAVRWPGVVRRGAIFSVPVPASVVAPTGPVIPKTIRLAIHWPGPVRRGKIFFIPSSSQAAPTVTPISPRMIQQHQQTRILARRGRILPFIGGQPGWVPPPTRPSSPVGARGARPGMTPRGRRWITPTTPTGPIPQPPIGPARRILAVRPPRGRFLPMPYPPAVVVPPPLYVARIMRQRARFWFFARRGRLQFTRLTGAFGFPAEFASASRALDMIGAGSAVEMATNATTGSAEFVGGDRGVTFVDGDMGTEFRGGP